VVRDRYFKTDCLKRKLETKVYNMIIASNLKIAFKKKSAVKSRKSRRSI
jgi:hypothetical protein